MQKIHYIIYTKDLANCYFINLAKTEGIQCLEAIDSRSAVYMATGISASNKEAVYVFINSSNSSRSAFCGMTEAFYRKLPVILVTLGSQLDYTQELNDVVLHHIMFENESELPLIVDPYHGPMHFEVRNSIIEEIKTCCSRLQKMLSLLLNKNHYLYISPLIRTENFPYRCKVVEGGMPNCYEGSISNILGASLCRRKERYIGLVTEDEVIHDINSLGNRHVNDLLFFIVLCRRNINNYIINYAESLAYNVIVYSEHDLTEERVSQLISDQTKSLLMVLEDN